MKEKKTGEGKKKRQLKGTKKIKRTGSGKKRQSAAVCHRDNFS